MAKNTRPYVEIEVKARFNTNQVEVRDLLMSLAHCAAINSGLEEENSPQKKNQLAIANILCNAAEEIKKANKVHWENNGKTQNNSNKES